MSRLLVHLICFLFTFKLSHAGKLENYLKHEKEKKKISVTEMLKHITFLCVVRLLEAGRLHYQLFQDLNFFFFFKDIFGGLFVPLFPGQES